MTHRPSQPDSNDGNDLAQRYAEHGRVEPPEGLDRMIRARAEQAVADRSPRRPARWVGGLATAMALVLAVVVVVRQEAPTPESLSIPSGRAFDRSAEAPEPISDFAADDSPPPAPASRQAAQREGGQRAERRAALDAAGRSTLGTADSATASRFTAPDLELAESVRAEEALAEDFDPTTLSRAIVAAIESEQFERAAELLDVLSEQDVEQAETLRARLEAARIGGPDGD